jgi:hypothetical protein
MTAAARGIELDSPEAALTAAVLSKVSWQDAGDDE